MQGKQPLAIFFHGGGFVLGSVVDYHSMTGKLARITVMGNSAGGNLATVMILKWHDPCIYEFPGDHPRCRGCHEVGERFS